MYRDMWSVYLQNVQIDIWVRKVKGALQADIIGSFNKGK
jgi:hypothetical protein